MPSFRYLRPALLLLACGLCLALASPPVVSINSDSLYPTLFNLSNVLQFRTPPSNYLFPDLLIHGLSRAFTTDGLDEKYLAGFIQLSLCLWACTLILDFAASLLVVALLYFLSPDIALNTASHTGMLFLSALVLRFRDQPVVRNILLAVGIGSDPLLLLPVLAIGIHLPALAPQLRRSAPAIGVGLLFAAFMNEGSIQLLQFYALIPVLLLILLLILLLANRFCPPGWIQALRRYLPWLALLLTGACLVVHFIPARYTLPLFIVMLTLVLFDPEPIDSRQDRGRSAVGATLSLAVLLILPVAAFSGFRHSTSYLAIRDSFDRQWGATARMLEQTKLDAVIVDYWEAKPLALARTLNGSHFGIFQMDFRARIPDTWIAPYDMVVGQSEYRLYDTIRCATEGPASMKVNQDKYCSAIPGPAPRELALVGQFRLLEYAQPIPAGAAFQDAAALNRGKLASFTYNMKNNFAKLLKRTHSGSGAL